MIVYTGLKDVEEIGMRFRFARWHLGRLHGYLVLSPPRGFSVVWRCRKTDRENVDPSRRRRLGLGRLEVCLTTFPGHSGWIADVKLR